MSTLKITTGPAEGQSIDCDRELVIGREGADVVVEDFEMSRRHATIRPVAAGLEIEDLGSLNGTFVDGQRISGAVLLMSSATVKMGITEFAVEVTASEQPLLNPQRTVVSGGEREQPAIDIADRTTVRNVPEEPATSEVADRTTVRQVPAEPVADASDRTTVRQVPAEPVAEASDRTTVRKVSDEPIIDVSDRTVVRDAPVFEVADRTVVRDVAAGAPPAGAAAGSAAGAPSASGPSAGMGAPGAPPAGAPPFAGPPGPLPPPVRILIKTPLGRRLMPLLVKLPPRARPPALLALLVLLVAIVVAIIVVIVTVVL
jgi:hypothetical protein